MRMPTYTIKAVAYYGNDIGGSDYRDSRDIIGTVPMMFREGLSFLKSNLRHLQAGQNFNSVGKLEIPEVVLEELLQNALVHVDLLGSAYIRLLIFDNRIEIINPGSLFGGLTVEDIRLGKSKQRNQLMADFCARTMIYRGLGSGIPRVLKEDAKIDFVSDDNTGDFKTIIWRDADLAVLEEGSGKSKNSSPKTGESWEKTEESTQKSTMKTVNSSEKTVNSSEKTKKSSEKIIEIIGMNSYVTTYGLMEVLGLSQRMIEKHLRKLREQGLIRRVGPDKGGHWEVVGMSDKMSE